MTPEQGFTPDRQAYERSPKTGLNDFDVDQLLAQLKRSSPETLAALRQALLGRDLAVVRDRTAIRYLNNGVDITDDTAGVQVAPLGSSYADRINFRNNLVARWAPRPFQDELIVDAEGGGGLDCLADIIVSSCWAAVVAAGDGEEGEHRTTATGCDLYFTSTVQLAWDGVGDLLVANGGPGGAKDFGDYCIVFICPGDAGPLSITTDGGDDTSVTFVGMGEGSQINHPTSGSTAVSVTGGTRPLVFRDLMLAAVSNTAAIVSDNAASQSASFDNVTFGISTGRTPVLDSATGINFNFYNCRFNVNQASSYAFDNLLNANDTLFTDCVFADRARPGSETKFKDCRFNLGTNSIGIDASNAGLNIQSDVWAEGCEFRGSAASFTSYINCDSVTGGLEIHVSGCWSTVGATQAILIAAGYLANGTKTQHIVDNRWACALGLNYTGTAAAEGINYSGNSHQSDAGSNTPFIYAQGRFQGCEFSGNSPALGYVSFSASSDANRVNGIVHSNHVPTHTANEGSLFFDTSANTMYVNTNGSTTWAVLGVAGGGPAVGPHALLDDSVHTDSALGTPTKGDLIAGSGTEWDDLPVGADDTILMADAAQTLGVKWAAAATTAQIADVAATETAGTSDTYARGDHRHAHGSGYLPDAHHTELHAGNHDAAVAGTDILYSVATYVNVPDAAYNADITTGDQQGVIHTSGGSQEEAFRGYIHSRTAPTGADMIVEWEYSDIGDLDLVASWTRICLITLPDGTKSVFTTTMTNASIPANRLIRTNWDQVGAAVKGQNANSSLFVKRGVIT